MRRLALLIAFAALVTAGGWLAWRSWTAAPAADAVTLAAAATPHTAGADGVLVLGEPARAGRWLARHPQVVALLAPVAADAVRRTARLRGPLAAMAGDARGPLCLWWRGRDLAGAAPVGAGTRDGLREVAALAGLSLRAEASGEPVGMVAVATSPALLDAASGGAPVLRGGRWAAIVCAGTRTWWVRAGRDEIEAIAGEPPPLPDLGEHSRVTSRDAGALLAAVSPGLDVHSPARLVVAGDGAWALAVPGVRASRDVERLLGAAGLSVGPSAGGTAVASLPALLPAVSGEVLVDEGAIRGADLAALVRRLAAADAILPLLGLDARELRRAAALLAGVRAASWKLTPTGGHILVEW